MKGSIVRPKPPGMSREHASGLKSIARIEFQRHDNKTGLTKCTASQPTITTIVFSFAILGIHAERRKKVAIELVGLWGRESG
jgi:hypothetical protein